MNGEDERRTRARSFLDEAWRAGVWPSERATTVRRYARMAELLGGRRYRRALELGCGDGAFAARLVELADQLLAVDASEEAIARATSTGTPGVEFRAADVMQLHYRDEGPWDLIVVSEVLPYLGWLYTVSELGWLARELYEVSEPGGRLLLVNTARGASDWLYRPYLIRTYRDLFRNVGFEVTHEEALRDEHEGIELEYLLTLYERTADPAASA